MSKIIREMTFRFTRKTSLDLTNKRTTPSYSIFDTTKLPTTDWNYPEGTEVMRNDSFVKTKRIKIGGTISTAKAFSGTFQIKITQKRSNGGQKTITKTVPVTAPQDFEVEFDGVTLSKSTYNTFTFTFTPSKSLSGSLKIQSMWMDVTVDINADAQDGGVYRKLEDGSWVRLRPYYFIDGSWKEIIRTSLSNEIDKGFEEIVEPPWISLPKS